MCFYGELNNMYACMYMYTCMYGQHCREQGVRV
jgi:hypothetical protein